MIGRLIRKIVGFSPPPVDPLRRVKRRTFEVRDFSALKMALGWGREPRLDADVLRGTYKHLTDLNFRRFHDLQVVAGACCNGEPQIILEIGTSHGEGTVVMAENAPDAVIHTVNMPPEDADLSGTNITHVLDAHEIGRAYRQAGCKNVRQILANTAEWVPDFGPIDVAFIDGCHDADFVYSDTLKILGQCKPGSVILWHDFNPDMVEKHHWIMAVCKGVERLYAEGLLHGPVLHLQDSWVGLYRVTEQDL